ncbi:MlaA family lipoprotein [Actibacterium pelagium]|uniref:Phospholipid-binding lipoprotein MlaA n=1 Tax=Actibacterium pelagium TaxID=2029103 RepID=A0A917AFW1_9RHOB|nr:VacJ family lipoprotein [Actibacterium pelagium]GGE49797.1 hypothetical protein GCM10011517_16950 [Actibacterium pelagium]
MPRLLQALALVSGLFLAACSQTDPTAGYNDPLESANRGVHAFNKGLDTAIVRPASKAYGTVLPKPVRQGVSNIASNLGEPSNVINNVMQGRLANAAHNTVRFVANSTIGLAGTFDVATAIGLEERDTDFGETLHVWGAQEGAYLELPLLGPSTSRDAVGTAVDFVLNPVETMFHDDVRKVQTATNIGSRLGDRNDFSNTVDSILYDSEDSYAQTRLTYLQNRRFKLGGSEAEVPYIDPYEDPYGQ